MKSDYEIAKICRDLELGKGDFDHVISAKGIVCAVKKYPDSILYVPRGTKDLLDLIRDALAAALISTPYIGLVPLGFYEGIPELFAATDPLTVGLPIQIGGHSLGASHAAQFTGEILARGGKVAKLTCFGSPTPGGLRLKTIIEAAGTSITSYRNKGDPVPSVPRLPCLMHIKPFTEIAIDIHATGPFAFHHIENYIAGTKPFEGAT